MADNYGAVRAQLLALLNRTDCTSAIADTFFDRAYTRINRELTGPVLDTETLYTHAGSTTDRLPIDTKTVLELWVNGYPYESGPDRTTPVSEAAQHYGGAAMGPSYRRVGRTVLVSPALMSGDVVRLLHQPRLRRPADVDFDTLVDVADDLLLYCALVEAGLYFDHDATKTWEDRYAVTRDALNGERDQQHAMGGPMVMQPMAAAGSY